PEMPLSTPRVAHRLARRFAVNVEEHRVLLRRIEVRRLETPGVELDAVADVDAKEFARGPFEHCQLLAQLLVLRENFERLVIRQRDDLRHRRLVECRERVNRGFATRRDLIRVRTGDSRRLDANRGLAIETGGIEITLRWPTGRRDEV